MDGIHVNIRLEEHKLCLLVMVGVRADGRKELVVLTDGYRESAESWADLLRDCARRGMRAPVLAIGDGALGFWSALREVFPQAREQKCWFHRSRKRSTCRRVALVRRCGEQIRRRAVSIGRGCGRVTCLLEQGAGFADDVADGGSADIAQSVGQDLHGAEFPLVEDCQQDTFAVADLLGKTPDRVPGRRGPPRRW